jgi:hypothetical protein
MSDCELGTSASLPHVMRGAETRSRLEKRTLRRRFLEPAPPRAPGHRDPLCGDHNTSPAVRIHRTASATSGSAAPSPQRLAYRSQAPYDRLWPKWRRLVKALRMGRR